MKIVTRAEAKAQGLKRYFTGKPCVHGHIEQRHTKGGGCMGCARIMSMRYYRNNPEACRKRHTAWTRKNSEHVNAYNNARYWRDPEKGRAINLKSRSKFRSRNVESTKIWRQKNPEKLKELRRKALLAAKLKRSTDETYRTKRLAETRRWYLEGPQNPTGETQWLRKNQAQLRTVKRLLRNLGVGQSLSEE
jgi:hypothetical protein